MNKKPSPRAFARFRSSNLVSGLFALAIVLGSSIGLAAQEDSRANTKALSPEAVAPFAAILNEAQIGTLLAKGLLTVGYSGSAQTMLSPNPQASATMTPSLNAVKPSIGIETLVVYPLPASLAAKPDRDLLLYNIMHRYRSMEGIEYWSASRKAMRIFFTASRLVKSPTERRAQPDPIFSALEAHHQLYLEQEDSSFGKNLYDLSVDSLPAGAVLLNLVNREQFWYGIVPVLAPRALSMYILVQPSADGKYLYFYGNTGINAAKAFGVEEKAKTSFTNRMTALFNWYAREMEAVR